MSFVRLSSFAILLFFGRLRQGSTTNLVGHPCVCGSMYSYFNCLSDTWPSELGKLLKESNATLDAVIDSAGGDILSQTSRLMKAGGKLVCYGM